MKSVFSRCLLCLLTFLGVQASSASWFEGVNGIHHPWLYHVDHGWMYATDGEGGGAWLWDTRLGWVWTNETAYPYVYEPLAGWVLYRKGARAPREFKDLSTTEWLVDDSPGREVSYFPVPAAWETFFWSYTVNGGQPVEGTFDGITMSFSFNQYQVTFRGSDLNLLTGMRAGISGIAFVQGQRFWLGGSVELSTQPQLARSALGLFELETDVDMDMILYFDSQPILFTSRTSVFDYGELAMAFPWQTDLYEEPLNKTFYQVLHTGRIAGFTRFEVPGDPNSTEEEFFDYVLDPPPTFRMEIVAKHDTYILGNGTSYQRVVEIAVTQTTPDPSTGLAEQTDGRVWLAPGTGVIRSLEDNPIAGQPIVIELDSLSL